MVHHERYTVFVTFIFVLMAGVGLMCVHKLNTLCGSSCKVGGVAFEVEVTRLGREGEDGGGGDSLLQGIEHLLLR